MVINTEKFPFIKEWPVGSTLSTFTGEILVPHHELCVAGDRENSGRQLPQSGQGQFPQGGKSSYLASPVLSSLFFAPQYRECHTTQVAIVEVEVDLEGGDYLGRDLEIEENEACALV